MQAIPFHGQLVDCDTHLYVEPGQFEAAFGADFARRFKTIHDLAFGRRDVTQRARLDVSESNVWEVKHWDCAGSYDITERLRALEIMGIDRQILFPDGIVSGILNSSLAGATAATRNYNEYALDWARPSGGRLRPASVLRFDSPDVVVEAERLVSAGAFGFTAYCGRPPGGLSPADASWDPLWALLAESGRPLLLHSGSESGFLDKGWTRGTRLDSGPAMGAEGGPFALAMSHLAPKVFLSALVLGGVLERHPGLKVGVLEFMANWLGPFAELLDQSVDFYPSPMGKRPTLKPSELLQRQVRLTPFFWEPVGTYIARYGLEDCYVFSSDYPHEEGGVDPVRHLAASLSSCEPTVRQKVFVDSGKDLCPDLP